MQTKLLDVFVPRVKILEENGRYGVETGMEETTTYAGT